MFFSITIQSPYTPLPSAITTPVSMSISPFSFLLNPFTPYPLPVAVIYFPSTSLFLFCLLVQIFHQIPHRSEIIWYLSFSDWLISLSIMFSRSIYIVAKDKIFVFFYGRVEIYCVNVPQLFYPLIYRWTLGLCPSLRHCQQCCNEHRGASVLSNQCFGFLWIYSQKWDSWFKADPFLIF